jgi:hypothetical protein
MRTRRGILGVGGLAIFVCWSASSILGADENLPPTVTITSPTDGEVYLPDRSIPIRAVTRDPDGYAPNVGFYADGELIGAVIEFEEPPPGEPVHLVFRWRSPPPGEHQLTARARDNRGATAETEQPVTIRVLSYEDLRRADINADSRVNVSDAVFLLLYLYRGASAPICDDIADLNDNGHLELADAVFLLTYLFGRGPAPPPLSSEELEDCGGD